MESLLGQLGVREASLWLLEPDRPPHEVTISELTDLASNRFTVETQAHADLLWLSSSDQAGRDAVSKYAQDG